MMVLSLCRPRSIRGFRSSDHWRAKISPSSSSADSSSDDQNDGGSFDYHDHEERDDDDYKVYSKAAPSEVLVLHIRYRDWDAARRRVLRYPRDANYRMKTRNRATPLHLALMHRAPKDLVALIADADPSALLHQDTEGWTPLHVNILYGGGGEDAEATTLSLIRRGGHAAAALHSKFVGAPLHLACRHGCSLQVLSELIKINPEQIGVPNEAGSTPASLCWKTHLRQNPPQSTGAGTKKHERNMTHARRLADQIYLMLEATLDRSQQWYEVPGLHDVIVFQRNYASEADCVGLFLQVYPESPKRFKEGSLPLHKAAAYEYSRKNRALHYWFPETIPSDPLHLLMDNYEDAASVVDSSSGRFPLHIALDDGRRSWMTGVDRLVRACPEALSRKDPKTALFPFQLAATATPSTSTSAIVKTTSASSSTSTTRKTSSKLASSPSLPNNPAGSLATTTFCDETDTVETIYRLLLACPQVIQPSPSSSSSSSR